MTALILTHIGALLVGALLARHGMRYRREALPDHTDATGGRPRLRLVVDNKSCLIRSHRRGAA